MFGRTFTAAAVSAALVLGSAVGASASEVETSSVIDGADLFTSAQETTLVEEFTADFEQYDLVFVVETITALHGVDIESYSLDRANVLGVGDAEKDNGVFVLISRDDREVWFQTGASVDDVVSDATVQDAVDTAVLPSFRNGDYFTGVIAGADYIGEAFVNPAAEDATGWIDWSGFWGSFWKWTGIVLGSIVGLILLLVGIREVRYRREVARKRRVAATIRRRENFINEIVGHFSYNREADNLMVNAKNEEVRQEILKPLFARYLESDPNFSEFAYERFMEAYLGEKMDGIARKHRVNMLKYIVPNNQLDLSIADMLERFEEAAKRRRVQDDEAIKRRAAQEKARREAEEKARKERQRLEKLQKEASKVLWDSLTSAQKAEIRKARTKKDKIKALNTYNTSPLDTNVMFPILFALYATEIGQPASEAYGSSRSSSSSSSSSYSSSSSSHSSYDTSSFSGGGFDGGGGGGSW